MLLFVKPFFLTKNDVLSLLKELDAVLEKSLEIYIIGGANLIAQGFIQRATHDIDVILPPQFSEDVLRQISHIANEHHIEKNWINTMPSRDALFLSKDWQERSILFYKGKKLSAFLLGRKDIIGMKLAATIDRGRDAEDLLAMEPTDEEWEFGRKWARAYDGHSDWADLIDKLVAQLKKKQHA